MKSRSKLVSFASVLALCALGIAACQDDSTSSGTPSTAGGGGSPNAGSGGQGGSTAGSSGQGGSAAGTAGSAGSSSGDECGGEEKTLVELNQVKAPLPENRLRLKGVVATSRKFLISNSNSGCLWGVFVTTPGASVVEYGSIQVVSKGEPPITDQDGKKVCLTDAGKTGAIPDDIQPGDTLDVSGFLDEFLLNNCGQMNTDGTTNPKPAAGQRQLKESTCFQKTGSGAVPAPHEISDIATVNAIAAGTDAETLYKWASGLVKITAPLTTKLDPTEGVNYFNCSAVSGFGDLVFNETPLVVNNNVYYNDFSCTGPRDTTKRYDFAQPTSFTSVSGLLAIDFCTWQLSVPNRCDSFSPQSPSCAVTECEKPANPVTSCPPEDTAELCSDGADNDGDKFIDCEDKNCCNVVDCKTTAPTSFCGKGGTGGGGAGGAGGATGSEDTAAACADGADNDGDNFIDCEDKNCCSVVDCKTSAPNSYCGKQTGGAENTAALCADGADNDGDNFIDCEDKNCCTVVDCKTSAPNSYCGKM